MFFDSSNIYNTTYGRSFMKKFTREELKSYNGQDGKPVYVVFEGKVYDLSSSPLWEGGRHEDEHDAGQDLTRFINEAPHDESYLEDFDQVGELVEE